MLTDKQLERGIWVIFALFVLVVLFFWLWASESIGAGSAVLAPLGLYKRYLRAAAAATRPEARRAYLRLADIYRPEPLDLSGTAPRRVD